MSFLWSKISDWFTSKGGLTHVLAAVSAFFVLAYSNVPSFHTEVNTIYNALPSWLAQLITVALALYTFYHDSTSTKAKKIQAIRYTQTGKLAAWALIALLFPPMLALQGCTVSAAEVKADGQDIATALINVADIEQATNPALAAQLNQVAAGIQSATANWQTGSPTAAINDALNASEAVLILIPQTQAVAILIPIAEAAIDALIAAIPPAPASVKIMRVANPYKGYKIHHHFGKSLSGDFKADWNGTIKLHPQLSAALLK